MAQTLKVLIKATVSADKMVKLQKLNPLTDSTLEELGFTWHTDSDGSKYVNNELVVISQEEAEAYYEAVNTIYDMYVEAAEYVIENDLFFELGIPFNLVDMIKKVGKMMFIGIYTAVLI